MGGGGRWRGVGVGGCPDYNWWKTLKAILCNDSGISLCLFVYP